MESENSLFSKSNREDEFIDDEFIASIGFGQIINGAYRKILRNIDNCSIMKIKNTKNLVIDKITGKEFEKINII